MEVRFGHSPREVAGMSTQELRDAFLTDSLMQADQVRLVYTHYDRVIMGGASPVRQRLILTTHSELKADFFLQRRELGIINVGGKGKVTADNRAYELNKQDCLYLGKGVQDVVFESADGA